MITPEIKYLKTADSTATSLGNIITSNISNGVINNAFTFNNNLYFSTNNTSSGAIIPQTYTKDNQTFGNLRLSGPQGNSSILDINKHQFKMEGIDETQIVFRTPNSYTKIDYDQQAAIYKIDVNSAPINFTINSGSDYRGLCICKFSDNNGTYTYTSGMPNWQCKIYTNIPFYSHEYIRLAGSSGYIRVDGTITAGSYIEGLYFNATSDKRAKTNITRSTFSALGLIKALPIYNFKYKSDNSDSIGIIAQEALNVSAGDFSLVCNPQASGENGNYMSVKESKLVYIAWKAIQEQQEIIDKQQEQINQLTELVNKLIQK